MHKEAQSALIRQIKEIAEEMIYPAPHSIAGQKIIGGLHLTSSFTLTDKGDELNHKLIHSNLYSRWSDKFSKEFIEKRIIKILLRASEQRDTTNIETMVQELIGEYESFDTEYTVILPLVGVSIGAIPIEFGNITIRNYNDLTVDNLADRYLSILHTIPNYKANQKSSILNMINQNYLSGLRNRACSEYTIKAEPSRAVEKALDETRQILNLFRYAILFLFTKEQPRAVGILGDVSDDHFTAVAIQNDDQGIVCESKRRNHSLALNEETIARMRAIGVFDLLNLITKQGRTKFEDIILRSVYWLASAQAQVENENALLNLVTCLETFFKAEAGSPIASTIAEGVALLTTTEITDRRERKKRISHFYSKRSKLTHEGDGEITSDELLELTLICRDLTTLMLQHRTKFTHHDQFRNWLEDQKLSGTVNFPA